MNGFGFVEFQKELDRTVYSHENCSVVCCRDKKISLGTDSNEGFAFRLVGREKEVKTIATKGIRNGENISFLGMACKLLCCPLAVARGPMFEGRILDPLIRVFRSGDKACLCF